MTVRNSTFGQVVGAQFDGYPVSGEDANEKLPHLSADVGEEFLPVFKTHFESCIGQSFDDFRVESDLVLLGHPVSGRVRVVSCTADLSNEEGSRGSIGESGRDAVGPAGAICSSVESGQDTTSTPIHHDGVLGMSGDGAV